MVSTFVPSLLLAVLLGAPVDGTWTGTLPAPGKPLHLVFHLTKSGATVDSPDQNARGIPITGLDTTGSSVRILVRSISGTFFGQVSKSGNEMNGVWKQGVAMSLTVRRSGG